jgi:phosphoglucosamine mutase
MFQKAGLEVHSLNDSPEGENINRGGALDPFELRKVVLDTGADVGVALDGDGDRAVFIDETGNILHGDDILAILSAYVLKKGMLRNKAVVGSIMCNLGLKLFLESKGINLKITKVGDKYVLEEMLKSGLNLGGEPSGHIIFLDYLPTSDGMLTALQVLRVLKDTGVRLSQLRRCMERFPQVLINVKVKERRPFEQMQEMTDKLNFFNSQLKNSGRIFLRYSGTEDLARIMVEGKDKGLITAIADSLAHEIRKEIGVECDDYVES